jgi:putative membrane protein (TIGR04086 family)
MTAVLIMIYSFLIKSLNIPDAWFKPINIVTKMAAAFLAAFLASRRMPGLAWAFGALAGMLYMLSGYLLFSLLDRAFGPVAILLGDTVMGAIVGFAAGILTRMLPEKRMAKR